MTRKRERTIGRRQFLANTAAAGAAVWVMSPMARVLGANDRLRLGLIGGGARGQELLSQALKLPNVELVAVADVYTRRHDEVRRVAPAARAFSDHRRLPDLKDGRPARPFDAFRFINWRLFWEFSGGNITENMVHQLSWIMGVLDLPVPVAAYMSGGVFSEKDGREVPDTIAVTLDFPTDLVVTWQSTFSNSRYGLGERILGSHGTVERVSGSTDMVTGRLPSGVRYDPEKANRPDGAAVVGESPDQDHMANFVDCVRSRKTPNAPVEVGYRTAVAAHMANLAYRQKARVTAEMAMATGAR